MANPHLLTVAGAAQALHLFPVHPGRFHPGTGTRDRARGYTRLRMARMPVAKRILAAA
jgi:hypothetical protein